MNPTSYFVKVDVLMNHYDRYMNSSSDSSKPVQIGAFYLVPMNSNQDVFIEGISNYCLPLLLKDRCLEVNDCFRDYAFNFIR